MCWNQPHWQTEAAGEKYFLWLLKPWITSPVVKNQNISHLKMLLLYKWTKWTKSHNFFSWTNSIRFCLFDGLPCGKNVCLKNNNGSLLYLKLIWGFSSVSYVWTMQYKADDLAKSERPESDWELPPSWALWDFWLDCARSVTEGAPDPMKT